MRNPGAYAEVLAPLLHVDRAQLLSRLSDRTHGFVYLARQREPGIKKSIAYALAAAHLNAGAIGFVAEPKRVYPQRLALQLLGATDPDGNGLAGAEKSLDGLLAGTPGSRTVLHDRDGQVVRVEHEQPAGPARPSGLRSTATSSRQAETIAAQTLVKWKANAVTIVALDPRNGGMLAMASAPGVPTGGYSKATPDRAAAARGGRRLRARLDVQGRHHRRGAAAGRRHAEHAFTVPCSMSPVRPRDHDADHHGTETLTVAQILAESSNVGTVTIARSELGGQTAAQPAGSTSSASASRPASTCPASSRAPSCRCASGRGRAS